MLVVLVLVVLVGGTRLKKSGLYLYAKKLGASVLLQFWRPRRCFYNFGAEGAFFLINFDAFRRFLLSVLAPKALFIINFGAEGAFYCQRRFVKTLCIVL